MPSNRSLPHASAAILSAVDFARGNGVELVISDNSGDAEKAAWLASLGDDIVVLADGPQDAGENMLSAFEAARGTFVLPMGDDDLIRGTLSAVDLSPEAGLSGVRPLCHVLGADGTVRREVDWTETGDDGAGRMLAHARRGEPDNATYYSAWARRHFLPLCRLFVRHHPLGMGSSDWAMVSALIGRGRLGVDRSMVYSYRLGGWQAAGDIAAGRAAMVEKAGLPPQATRWMSLFHHLDCHCYLEGFGEDMPETERLSCQRMAAMIFLRAFLRQVHREPGLFPELAGLVSELIAGASPSRSMRTGCSFTRPEPQGG